MLVLFQGWFFFRGVLIKQLNELLSRNRTIFVLVKVVEEVDTHLLRDATLESEEKPIELLLGEYSIEVGIDGAKELVEGDTLYMHQVP